MLIFFPRWKMNESPERQLSDVNVKRLKEQLNIERNEWPSKRELYTICGKLGEGATGNVNGSREDHLIFAKVSFIGPCALDVQRENV